MLKLGLVATVNSDDPAYFGGYVNDNFESLVDAVNLGAAEIMQLVRNSFDSAFLQPDRKARHLLNAEAVYQKYTEQHGNA
jgi:adenosine deaminase